MADTDSCISA